MWSVILLHLFCQLSLIDFSIKESYYCFHLFKRIHQPNFALFFSSWSFYFSKSIFCGYVEHWSKHDSSKKITEGWDNVNKMTRWQCQQTRSCEHYSYRLKYLCKKYRYIRKYWSKKTNKNTNCDQTSMPLYCRSFLELCQMLNSCAVARITCCWSSITRLLYRTIYNISPFNTG